MSYILEALKKSQQQRELGRVPTLDTSGMFTEDKEPAPKTYWGLLAVGLASVAVVVALFALLRVPPAPPAEPASPGVSSGASTGRTGASAVALPEASRVATADADRLSEGRSYADPPTSAPPLASVSRPEIAPTSVPPTPASVRRAPAREPLPEDEEALMAEEVGDPSDWEPDAWLEQELQRELDAEQAMYEEPPPPVPRRRPQRAEVPADLVEDIESFKQQIRREQGIPPPEALRRSADIRGDPTKLRLTPLQQAQVPAYFMTVHVYDEDPTKRFVLINALRYVEGEETRDGIRVERIIPEGAVLSYLGNPFFVRR